MTEYEGLTSISGRPLPWEWWVSPVFVPGRRSCWGAQSKDWGSRGDWCCWRPAAPGRCWRWSQTRLHASLCPTLDGTRRSGRGRSSSYWSCSTLYKPGEDEQRGGRHQGRATLSLWLLETQEHKASPAIVLTFISSVSERNAHLFSYSCILKRCSDIKWYPGCHPEPWIKVGA